MPVQVKTTITRYQPFINWAGRNSLGSGPSHTISIKSLFLVMGVLQQSFNAIHRELPLTLSSGWTQDQSRNTIIKLPKTAYISFIKVRIQII